MSPSAPAEPSPGSGRAGTDGGFLAIDALVGLSIMALGLVFTIEVSAQTLRLLSQANDLRAATAQAALCLEARTRTVAQNGQPQAADMMPDHNAFAVRAYEVAEPSTSGKPLCLVECVIRSLRSKAAVRVHTQRLCQSPT